MHNLSPIQCCQLSELGFSYLQLYIFHIFFRSALWVIFGDTKWVYNLEKYAENELHLKLAPLPASASIIIYVKAE